MTHLWKSFFGESHEKRLNLITCTEEFIRDRGGHQDWFVVYSKFKETFSSLSCK